MATSQSPEFKEAVTASKQLTQKPTNEELLDMYCLYKQALQDPPFEKAEPPGTFDFKGKAKYKAWKAIVDQNVTPEEAQTKYVALIEKMKEKYGYDPEKKPEAVGSSS